MPEPYETSAEAYARVTGDRDGGAAASWYTIDETNAAAILRGIEDGDPAVLDTFPFPDLSGQWADTLTGPQLVRDALEYAGEDPDGDEAQDAFGDICDAYEAAFSAAVEDYIGSIARAIVHTD